MQAKRTVEVIELPPVKTVERIEVVPPSFLQADPLLLAWRICITITVIAIWMQVRSVDRRARCRRRS